MSPAAIANNTAPTTTTGTHHVVKHAPQPAAPPKFTSADVIHLEHEYGAHK